MVKELKPCPFCGERGEVLVQKTQKTKESIGVVFCQSCLCYGPSVKSYDYFVDCITLWNKRVEK